MPQPCLIPKSSCVLRPPGRRAEALEFEDVEGSSRRGTNIPSAKNCKKIGRALSA
jgi:hypothetical protein